MSAPKPRVRRVQAPETRTYVSPADGVEVSYTIPSTWDWECPCRARRRPRSGFMFDVAVQAAVQHSRTHTAERIADYAAERIEWSNAIADGAPSHAAAYGAHCHAGAWEGAERIIRQHLVKETP